MFGKWLETEEQSIDPVVTFGKHSGKRVSQIPRSYLSWMQRKITNLSDDLRSAIRRELSQRKQDLPAVKYYVAKVLSPFGGGFIWRSKQSVNFEKDDLIALHKNEDGRWILQKMQPDMSKSHPAAFAEPLLMGKIQSLKDENGQKASGDNLQDLYDKYAKDQYKDEKHGSELVGVLNYARDFIQKYANEYKMDPRELERAVIEHYRQYHFSRNIEAIDDLIKANYNAYSDNPWAGHGFTNISKKLVNDFKGVLDYYRASPRRR